MFDEHYPKTDLWTYLTTAQKPVVLYGTGNGADKILNQLQKRNIPVAGIFASSDFVRNRTFRGFPVETYDALRARLLGPSDDSSSAPKALGLIVLICFGTSRPEVLSNIDRIAKECEVYAPDVPVYGANLFDTEFYAAHRDDLSHVRDMLEDPLSRDTFDAVVQYKLSGKYSLLRTCEAPVEEASSLLSLSDEAHFLDLGAYTGDTVQLYTSLFPKIRHVTAVEPDARNFRKLQENTRGISDVTCIRALVSDHDGTAFVDRNKGRGVHEESGDKCFSSDKNGDIKNGESLTATTLVTLLRKQKADLIKMDVEGNERAAILGGMDVIRKDKPALIVSCYHRSEDLFALPLLLKEIVPEYKIYMRHHPHLLCWDTEYLFTTT